MNYLLFAANNSSDLESTYLTKDPAALVTQFPEFSNNSSASQSASIYSLIQQFWDMLNNTTIPALENTWTACMKKLTDNMNDTAFDIEDMYKTFINENIDELVTDYTIIPFDDLKKCYSTPNSNSEKHCSRQSEEQNKTQNEGQNKEQSKELNEEQHKDQNEKQNSQENLQDVFGFLNINTLKELVHSNINTSEIENIVTTPGTRSTLSKILREYLNTESVRYNKESFLPGYINHRRDMKKPYELELENYYQRILYYRLRLFSKRE